MLKSLELWNFRNYRRRGFQFAGSEVCFCGENGVGKSNLLEAIYFLSILRSFRAGNVRDLVGLGGREFKLRGVWSSGGVDKVLEVEQTLGGGVWRLTGLRCASRVNLSGSSGRWCLRRRTS